jgi:hypothetical protein
MNGFDKVAEYHKIDTVFKRDPANLKKLLIGEYSNPAFEYLANNEWVFTEKVDGTNIRIIHGEGTVSFGGKTDNAQLPGNLLKVLEEKFRTPKYRAKIAELFGDAWVTFYGEGYGAKIQKGGGNYRPDMGFVLFDIRIEGWWLERHNVEDIAKKLDIDIVPIIRRGTLHDMVILANDGFKSRWGDFNAEGIVARPATELCDRGGNRIITKIKQRDFK